MTTILKNLVSKTATVASVKLLTPADRIGSGVVVATYPAEHLSYGQFMPARPVNTGGVWQALSAELMREHQAMATAEPPAGPAGRFPRSSAPCWFKRPTSRRASFPADSSLRERLGDCQSPERREDDRAAMSWEANPTPAAAI